MLDLHMPGMGGLDAQSQLEKSWLYLRVIFITGHEDLEVQRRALATRPLAFLNKPIDSHSLLRTIEGPQ
jgi:FixJ family two-component response regulator